ncbi:hypothetical protein FB465_4459 [Kitasatospora atroaurantiaca]|uniref:Uncharacterized protein n=1 Tax=Kitasatospora atroaurantiaca TaxID=285545 RepID=A0A561EUQ2_9ACTN|nr:hypothetical protein FB465_4459 [Kitasatospora atroaurantiaca]
MSSADNGQYSVMATGRSMANSLMKPWQRPPGGVTGSPCQRSWCCRAVGLYVVSGTVPAPCEARTG